MFTKEDPMSLKNLGDGAAIEKFDEELQKVLDNIIDPNTKPDAVREVKLSVKIKPDDNRNIGAISILSDSKLAPDEEFVTSCVIGKLNGKGLAREFKGQQSLFPDADGDKVVGIDTKTGEVIGE